MATFLLTGKYSHEALAGASAVRTRQAIELIQEHGGKVEAMYATLGQNDLLFVLDFPDTEKAMKASVELSRLTRISFTTSPAVSVEVFDGLMAGR